jgi:hypothetical protein
MNKYLTSGKIIILILSVTLTAAAFAGMPLLRSWWHPTPETTTDEHPRYGKKEAAILKELVAIYRRMDTLSVLDMGGKMTATDPAAPENDMSTDFSYCKKGTLLYYRMGESEMVQFPEVNISANKAVNKMFLTPPKTVITAPHLPVDSIIALWEDDRYTIAATETDQQVTVTLLSERHVACKELRITYNRASHKMNSIYMRLTNLSDPLNKALDRQMNVTFDKWEEEVADGKYFNLSSYLQKDGASWQPAGLYRNYKLISAL